MNLAVAKFSAMATNIHILKVEEDDVPKRSLALELYRPIRSFAHGSIYLSLMALFNDEDEL
jgi:hypothetical protein